ncbi:dienelactone hydrolase family protein [Natronomonas halophila]|uniref:alpha/beta hydrolase n=1 Tax=Natronomonas halophila TaxID=2747817 RepID=UPI0015B3BEF6|nr:dienelactone hydrolase family protein [Natronomonas halophila]QLD84519.1 dienelactone hydrolase family protein [Natronomonas halophila]
MEGPHQDQPLVTAGAPLDAADAAVVLVHGRGATAQSIVQMADEFYHHGVAFLAPQAARNTWYPNSFLAPVEANEPGRSSGLQAIEDAIESANEADIPTERVMLLGFSQGACLASEYVAQNPRRYGGLAVLSGGVIGPEGKEMDYEGDLEGTPVFLGCSDTDPHIPEERVHETAEVFEAMGADVTTRIYEGMGHGVNEDEIDHVSEMVENLVEE